MDAEERLRITAALAMVPTSELELFFAAHDLGKAWRLPPKGWGRQRRIAECLAAAEDRGDADRVLVAASVHFGLEPAATSDELNRSTTEAGSGQRPQPRRSRGGRPSRPESGTKTSVTPRLVRRDVDATNTQTSASRTRDGAPATTVFLSHVASEAGLASAIKGVIDGHFQGRVDVYSASDTASLPAGQRWLDSISTNLDRCAVQLMLLGPAAITRPWIYFEAGAVWSQHKPQIPLCHSGLKPAGLPVPLSLLQGGAIDDPGCWRSMFGTIARVVGCTVPPADFEAIANDLRSIASRLDKATSTTAPAEALVRLAGPELRALSADRQRLEQELYGAILHYTTLRAGGKSTDEQVMDDASAAAGLFWGNPAALSDAVLARQLETLKAAIARLEGPDVRLEALRELRQLRRRQRRTSTVLSFDISDVSQRLQVEPDAIQDVLTDLLAEGLAEPYYANFGQPAEDGACQITAAGMAELRRLEASPR